MSDRERTIDTSTELRDYPACLSPPQSSRIFTRRRAHQERSRISHSYQRRLNGTCAQTPRRSNLRPVARTLTYDSSPEPAQPPSPPPRMSGHHPHIYVIDYQRSNGNGDRRRPDTRDLDEDRDRPPHGRHGRQERYARRTATRLLNHVRNHPTVNEHALRCPNCGLLPLYPVTGICGHTRCRDCIRSNPNCPCGVPHSPWLLNVNVVVKEVVKKLLATETEIRQWLTDTRMVNPPETEHPLMPHEIHTAEAEIPPDDTQEDIEGLDPDILDLLGADPTLDKTYGEDLHKDLAVRWKHILVNGLPKEDKVEIMKRYLPAENCSFMKPPKLNPELKSALGESSCKRDAYSEQKQNQMASCISAIGKALNLALSQTGNISQDIVKTLSDAGRLLCDTHYRESLSRRFIIINSISKQKREVIKNTKMDELLFGSDLPEHLKTSKAIAKSATELKFTKPPPQAQPGPSGYRRPDALNAKGAPRTTAAEQRVNPGPAARRQPPPATPRDRRREATTARSTNYRQHRKR